MQDIKKSRDEIDEINFQILRLFERRMKISDDVADYKVANGLPIHDAIRERKILDAITDSASAENRVQARMLFQTLMDLSRSRQVLRMHGLSEKYFSTRIKAAIASTENELPKTGRIACQGVEGAYSQQAADKLFPLGKLIYFGSFNGVFDAVESGDCDFGILPIENSSHGTVSAVYDLMKDHSFSIVRSIKMKIDHSLLAKKGACLDNIKAVYSHEQAIGQCSRFFASHPEIEVIACANTAAAAKFVAESGRDDIAAIASGVNAGIYGLRALPVKIQNSDSNFTRFICISKEMKIYPGSDRVSIMLKLAHKPGALYRLIAKFAAMGINLTKIESRPIEGSDFEFTFFMDFDMSVYSDELYALLDSLDEDCDGLTFLGGYRQV